MNGAAQAHADTPPPPIDTEMAAVPHGQPVRERILDIARTEFDRQNPGTFYSEGIRQAWCANFVSWVMRQAGDPLTNVTNGSWRVPGVYTLRDTFASENKLEPVGYKPSPGDVVLYGGSGHTNIVVGVDGDNITTIGGNESNRVSQRTISRFSGDIMGFGRVADDEPVLAAQEFVAPPPPPAPEFVSINNEVPPPPVDPFLPPPAPEFVAVNNEVPPPPVDPFLPPPAPEFVAVNNEVPPPPPPVEFVPPAPEVIPAVFDAPPPPPEGEVVALAAPIEGVPHLSGALPGPVV